MSTVLLNERKFRNVKMKSKEADTKDNPEFRKEFEQKLEILNKLHDEEIQRLSEEHKDVMSYVNEIITKDREKLDSMKPKDNLEAFEKLKELEIQLKQLESKPKTKKKKVKKTDIKPSIEKVLTTSKRWK